MQSDNIFRLKYFLDFLHKKFSSYGILNLFFEFSDFWNKTKWLQKRQKVFNWDSKFVKSISWWIFVEIFNVVLFSYAIVCNLSIKVIFGFFTLKVFELWHFEFIFWIFGFLTQKKGFKNGKKCITEIQNLSSPYLDEYFRKL